VSERRDWSNRPIIIGLAIFATIVIPIVAFLTGKPSLPELFSPEQQQASTTAPPGDTLSPFGPSQISPTPPPATTAATSTTVRVTTPAPRNTVADDPNAEAPTNAHTGQLILQIELGKSGKIGPNTYRSPKELGWIAKTYDDGGELDEGCYIQWTLYMESAPIYKENSDCSTNHRTDLDLDPGSYRFVGDITTDWGATGSGQLEFQVVPG